MVLDSYPELKMLLALLSPLSRFECDGPRKEDWEFTLLLKDFFIGPSALAHHLMDRALF